MSYSTEKMRIENRRGVIIALISMKEEDYEYMQGM